MTRRPKRGTIRCCTSSSPTDSKYVWKYTSGARVHISGVQPAYKLVNEKLTRVILTANKNPIVYIGPTVEGPDAEYIKIVSGKVDIRKPSFI